MEGVREAPGSVVSLWRYPVKSMMGEEVNATELSQRGLLGDRAYALFDPSTGKIVSAKNPRKWANLFDFRAWFAEPPRPGEPLPPVRIALPDGTLITSGQSDANLFLSKAVGREVQLLSSAPDKPSLEEFWPDVEGLAHRVKVTDERMPAHTFFDSAVLHLLTTSTIDRLRELYPEGRFEPRRFRPNVVVQLAPDERGFVENGWAGRTLSLGTEVRLKITGPCPRCVMTTLPQGDLPRDPG
ncbi:MAG: MOSC domain-containing protein, partial [Thermoplasmata archaeon]